MILFCRFHRGKKLLNCSLVNEFGNFCRYCCFSDKCAFSALSLRTSRYFFSSTSIRNVRVLQKRANTDYCRQLIRSFSNNRNENTPSLKGVVYTIPNPINWIKNKLADVYIRNSVDPQFSMMEFKAGAIQVSCQLLMIV